MKSNLYEKYKLIIRDQQIILTHENWISPWYLSKDLKHYSWAYFIYMNNSFVDCCNDPESMNDYRNFILPLELVEFVNKEYKIQMREKKLRRILCSHILFVHVT